MSSARREISTRLAGDPGLRPRPGRGRRRLGACVAALLTLGILAGPARGDSQELPDPTRPPTAVPDAAPGDRDPAASALDLRAIFVSEGRRVALIDDRRVREGDRLGSARVLRIEGRRVLVEVDGEPGELELFATPTKRPTDGADPGAGPAPEAAPASAEGDR